MRHLPTVNDPNVLVGTETSDDAAVYQLNNEQALVVTLDYFTPIVDTPYEFGQIAAANSLSDLYAMGARPLMALNIVGFPASSSDLTFDILREILQGGADKARDAEIFIIGGHTIDDDEPKYGLVGIGEVAPGKVVRNTGAQIGDRLVLTKPIGTGIISTAIKQGVAPDAVVSRGVETMSLLNHGASEAMMSIGVHAATDVTGFGLLGHLREMTRGSRVGAKVSHAKVPVIEGVWELACEERIPGGTHANRDFLGDALVWDDGIPETKRLILCDAQTSGGLLMAVAPEKCATLLAALQRPDVLVAADIGEVVPDGEGRIQIV